MTERTLPTNTCPKCGKSMGLSHKCGLEQDVELKSTVDPVTLARELRRAYEPIRGQGAANAVLHLCCLIDKQAEQLDTMEDALRQIDNWAQAYPLEVFPKPDFKRAHAVLTAHGMTLDSISADSMRHVLEEIKGIVAEALKDGA